MNAVTRRKPGRPRDPDLARKRREEILDAAARMFAERGFQDTDLQILADHLGVGKGTVYRYFPTKRRLFLAAADRSMRLLEMQVQSSAADVIDPLDRITRAIRGYLRYFDTHPEAVELIIQERAHFRDRKRPTYFEFRDKNLDPWKTLLTRLIDEGRLRAIPLQRIIDVLGDLLYGTVFTNYFAGRTRSFEKQAQDILDIVLNGIVAKKGAP